MLRIADLTHVYPNGTRALDGVTLEVPRGMYGLLGPNGAGKSSLMRCIATLQIPTRGSIRFDDLDVLADPDALRRTLGYLPQDFGVCCRFAASAALLMSPMRIAPCARMVSNIASAFGSSLMASCSSVPV